MSARSRLLRAGIAIRHLYGGIMSAILRRLRAPAAGWMVYGLWHIGTRHATRRGSGRVAHEPGAAGQRSGYPCGCGGPLSIVSSAPTMPVSDGDGVSAAPSVSRVGHSCSPPTTPVWLGVTLTPWTRSLG